MGGDCGTCTMCCKVMRVQELQKPDNKLCDHCTVGVGCKIYDHRPITCAAFRCLWLQTQTAGNTMPLNLRPDKSKVVLHTSADGGSIVAKVDPTYPTAWQDRAMAYMLGRLSEKLWVLVGNGKGYWLIKDHEVREAIMSKPDADGIEHFLGYAGENGASRR